MVLKSNDLLPIKILKIIKIDEPYKTYKYLILPEGTQECIFKILQ